MPATSFHRFALSVIATGALATSCAPPEPTTPKGSGGATATGGTSSGGSPGSGGLGTGGNIPGTGGASSSGGGPGSGGSGGAIGTGGAATGGSAQGGANGGIGGAATGRGGNGGTGTAGSPGGGGQGGGFAMKNPPVPSAGCGKDLGTLKTGPYTMTSGGSQRKYAIDIPADYDKSKPYRLFFTFHWIGASQDVLVNGLVESINGTGVNGGADNYAFYGLKRQAKLANEPAIFIAPSSMGSTWTEKDHPYFDDLLAMAKDKLCIDTSRVFATGFSFGGMITYSLSLNHQKDLRAVVGMAPANYNIYLPTNTKMPIAYMSTTGMSDGTCPFDSGNNQGGKYTGIQHAMDNGCTVPATIPTTTKGSKTHLCYDYAGCPAGYPVKTCTFDGTHQCNVADGGTTNDGTKSWIPIESWKFFSQF